MKDLDHPLELLARSISYKNLTAAAQHVGLSQPQLSRLIRRLEDELQLTLLNRDSKRHSSWTKSAEKLAAIYQRHQQQLEKSINKIQDAAVLKELHIGALEGLIDLAMEWCHRIYKKSAVQRIHLNILDLSELEEQFQNKDLDLIFTSRAPGKQKPKNLWTLGYQNIEWVSVSKEFDIMSPFHFNQKKKKDSSDGAKTLISNSLTVRKSWLELYGGEAEIPSRVLSKDQLKRGSPSEPVLLVGQDTLRIKDQLGIQV